MRFSTYEDLKKDESSDQTFTVDQLASLLEEGASHYRQGIRISQSPYAGIEGRYWRIGWRRAFLEAGQPSHRISIDEMRACNEEGAAMERYLREHEAKEAK